MQRLQCPTRQRKLIPRNSSMNVDKAWQPFQPTQSKPWSIRLAAHLYRRAGFGATYGQLKQAATQGLTKTVDSLFQNESSEFVAQIDNLKKQVRSGGNVQQLPNYWLYRMAKTRSQLLEKTTLFWHGHFATSAGKVDEVTMMLDQNDWLRSNALKKFGPMVQGISKDPAMLTYLDSKVNRKTRPNENYARELMELFCLGLGNYTEDDIKQLARTFTGWEIRNDRFRFNKYQHDYGTKKFLGSSGEFNGEEAVEIVLKQKSSTEFIARKLINFFVTDYPVSDALVSPLAATLRESEFDIGVGVRKILTSNLFFESIGKKIRSPVELAIGFLRSTEATGNFVKLSGLLRDLGQLPFFPPNVKGWPGGRTWINSATLLGRINMISDLLSDEKTKYESDDLRGWVEKYSIQSTSDIIEFLESTLLAVRIPEKPKKEIASLLSDSGGSKNERIQKAIVAIASLPEFQLS